MKMPITTAESAAISYCLAAYIDNEGDKRDGIGTESLGSLMQCVLFCRAGIGDELQIDLVQLALLRKALETYQDDPAVDEDTTACLLARIDDAMPAVIPSKAGIGQAERTSEPEKIKSWN